MSDLNGNYAKVANSVTLTLVSRFAMIVATAALPVFGWMLQRGVSSVDAMSAKIDAIQQRVIETGLLLKFVQQNQESEDRLLADHESRVRALENYNRMRGAP